MTRKAEAAAGWPGQKEDSRSRSHHPRTDEKRLGRALIDSPPDHFTPSVQSLPASLSLACEDGQLDVTLDPDSWAEAHDAISTFFDLAPVGMTISVHLIGYFADAIVSEFDLWKLGRRATLHTVWHREIFEAQAETPEALALFVECFGMDEGDNGLKCAEWHGELGRVKGRPAPLQASDG